MVSESVNILILGGLIHLGRPLLCHLVALNDSIVKHIRFVDKYLIAGSASTTYVDPETLHALQDERVEYRQVNLTIVDAVRKVFASPNGGSFDYVFDLTGEGLLQADLPHQLLQERTTKLAESLAHLAAEHNVKAYIRDSPPFWSIKSSTPLLEDDLSKQVEAPTARAFFFYEAERAVAAQEDLPLAILRSANVYGPHQYAGTLTPKIALGEVYSHLKEPLKMLWSGEIRSHVIHSRDWCRVAWKAAQWTATRSRQTANDEAGTTLSFVKPKDQLKIPSALQSAASECPRAAVFNIADQDDLTHAKILQTVGTVYAIDTGFTNTAVNTWARFNLDSVVDESNEKHAEAMTEIMSSQTPPIVNTPLTCFVAAEDLSQRGVCLSTRRVQDVLQWQAKEHFTAVTVQEVIDSFKRSGVWLRR